MRPNRTRPSIRWISTLLCVRLLYLSLLVCVFYLPVHLASGRASNSIIVVGRDSRRPGLVSNFRDVPHAHSMDNMYMYSIHGITCSWPRELGSSLFDPGIACIAVTLPSPHYKVHRAVSNSWAFRKSHYVCHRRLPGGFLTIRHSVGLYLVPPSTEMITDPPV